MNSDIVCLPGATNTADRSTGLATRRTDNRLPRGLFHRRAVNEPPPAFVNRDALSEGSVAITEFTDNFVAATRPTSAATRRTFDRVPETRASQYRSWIPTTRSSRSIPRRASSIFLGSARSGSSSTSSPFPGEPRGPTRRLRGRPRVPRVDRLGRIDLSSTAGSDDFASQAFPVIARARGRLGPLRVPRGGTRGFRAALAESEREREEAPGGKPRGRERARGCRAAPPFRNGRTRGALRCRPGTRGGYRSGLREWATRARREVAGASSENAQLSVLAASQAERINGLAVLVGETSPRAVALERENRAGRATCSHGRPSRRSPRGSRPLAAVHGRNGEALRERIARRDARFAMTEAQLEEGVGAPLARGKGPRGHQQTRERAQNDDAAPHRWKGGLGQARGGDRRCAAGGPEAA